MPVRVLAAAASALLIAGVVAAVVGGDSGRDAAVAPVDPPTSSTSRPTSTTTTTAEPASTTTTEPPIAWPALTDDGVARALITPTGVVGAVRAANGDGSFVIRTPCGVEATVDGTPVSDAHVVLDPGHGGDEPGAVGPAGTTEKAINLAVAEATRRQLEALGATVVLTRTADYRVTLRSRAAIATALDADVFVSIHHNAEPDGPFAGPGAETYYQIESAESKRLSGLLVEEFRVRFAAYDIAWMGDTDAGAKYRLSSRGGNYYGILSNAEGVPTVLSEAAFISNPQEEALLVDPGFQRVEAAAITAAVTRFVTTDAPGSGFTEPYPRDTPAGGGGGSTGCVDPPLA